MRVRQIGNHESPKIRGENSKMFKKPPPRHDSDFLIPTSWICDSPRCLEKVTQHIFSQMVVNNGDESHGRIRKKSPNKQIQEI